MIKYIGEGNYYLGVPARDFTEDEWAAIPRRVRKRVLELGLYVEPKPERKSKREIEPEIVPEVDE